MQLVPDLVAMQGGKGFSSYKEKEWRSVLVYRKVNCNYKFKFR